MALVAYDCSNESDDEDLSDTEKTDIEKKTEHIYTHDLSNRILNEDSLNDEILTELFRNKSSKKENIKDHDLDIADEQVDFKLSFSKLPQIKNHHITFDSSKKNESKLKNINVSSYFTQMKPVQFTESIKIQSESQLCNLLPQPTNSYDDALDTNFEKPSVTEKSKLPTVIPTVLLKKKAVEKQSNQESLINEEPQDSDDDDFFSLTKDNSIDSSSFEPIDIDIPEKPLTNFCNVKSIMINDESQSDDEINENNYETSDNESSTVNSEISVELDDDAMIRLCGRKRKGQFPDDLQLIDIHEDVILAESKKMLNKHLTEEEVIHRPNRPKCGGLSSLSKRKHQITYLAYQAKEREIELKNQWANNRLTKRQTQSKYGF